MNMMSKQPIYNVDYITCKSCGRYVQRKLPFQNKKGYSWICSCGWSQNVWTCSVV